MEKNTQIPYIDNPLGYNLALAAAETKNHGRRRHRCCSHLLPFGAILTDVKPWVRESDQQFVDRTVTVRPSVRPFVTHVALGASLCGCTMIWLHSISDLKSSASSAAKRLSIVTASVHIFYRCQTGVRERVTSNSSVTPSGPMTASTSVLLWYQ